eukprot:scaffold248464_cov119-Cyclotella_meneghiniana.AAC.2
MVGGDNASRSIAIGMVLGAYHADALPLEWKRGLNHWSHSEELLAKLPLLKDNDSVQSDEL